MKGPENNFAGRLVKRLGESSCLIDAAAGDVVTSPDLSRLVSGFGAFLPARGLKEGDRILIGCSLSPASGIAYLGAMYAGLVPVPVDAGALGSKVSLLVEATGAGAVWTENSIPLGGIDGGDVRVLTGLPDNSPAGSIAPASCHESDLAVLMATSGSTRAPRFVMISHSNLIANTEAIIRSQQLAHDERAMLILPLSYSFGASVFHSHLYQGGGVVFDRRFMFPDKVLRAIEKYGCTTFAGVPMVYNILLGRSNLRTIPMPGLRRFLLAGGALAPQRVDEMRRAAPNPKFYVMYGQTEATARISCLDPLRLEDKPGCVGAPLDNLVVRIVDEQGQDLPTGEVGEILVRGPSVSCGYFNDEEESQRCFGDGWLKTGDLACRDEEGCLWIKGRKSGFLKIRGVRVSFEEIESLVAGVPGVRECAVTAVCHPEVGEAPVLWVAPEKGVENIEGQVRRRLPVQWTCYSVNTVSELPRNSHGKICRHLLGK
ncbi:MAG: class I adenylate-forming enzyme family protein [Syntrophobacteraceae bacterium]|nr:class I adenylate-forming enzyme family protein [Syntrophobacteraceae bacterium]